MIELEVEHNNFDTFVKRQEFAAKLAKAGIDNNWSFCPYTNDGINSDDFIGMRWTLETMNDIWVQFIQDKSSKITKLIIKVRYENMKDIETQLGEIAKEMIDDSFSILKRVDNFKNVNYYGISFNIHPYYIWIATDQNGNTAAYSHKPIIRDGYYDSKDIEGNGLLLGKVDFKGDWRKSLMEIK
jgi:hypothetical protein